MSADWKAGDIAVCVDVISRGHCFDSDLLSLKIGGIYRVSAVIAPFGGLQLVGVRCRSKWGFWEDRFRKLNDDPDNTAIIARIKSPIREKAHA